MLPLSLGLMSPAIAHNEANGGDSMHADSPPPSQEPPGSPAAGTPGAGWWVI